MGPGVFTTDEWSAYLKLAAKLYTHIVSHKVFVVIFADFV